MRVLVIDPDRARAALVAEGLEGVEPLVVHVSEAFNESEAAIFAPDVVVVAAESPDRDTLDSFKASNAGVLRPIVMFVDRSEPGLASEAVRAGVAAYVVDGLATRRVRAVLEVAMSRFQLMRQLRTDLEKAQADLASRKTVDRAKALIMKERNLEEPAAYALLRKLSMDTGRPMAAVASDFLAIAGVLRGEI
jgi:response regulator NasT